MEARLLDPPRDPGPRRLLAAPLAGVRQATHAVLAWIREQLTTTPGRLTLTSVAVVAGALVLGTVALTAERSRDGAAQAVTSRTEPLLLGAVQLYASLSHADATATTTFLTGGLEPPGRRALYTADVDAASRQLAALASQSATATSAQEAVATITRKLPVYTGLVEAARANNRQGFPVGAAYQRQASGLLAATILPAANHLYETAAARLDGDYRTGAATASMVAFAIALAAALFGLAVVQRHLARISRRILNLPILLATVGIAVLAGWGLVGLAGEQSALARAQHNGSDSVELLSATRILASRAQSDESLALVARGGDARPLNDFDAVMRALAPAGGGLLGQVAAQDRRTGTTPAARELTAILAAYQVRHAAILGLLGAGRFPQAVDLAVRSTAAGVAPADRLARNLSDQIAAAQARFAADAAAATGAVGGLGGAIPIVGVLAALLTLVGLRQRINEYR